ncbi:hypothetical protein OIU76_018238 [Salix suchowensis]|nr:hypothetical protein OIU76_018238 [Salix suchowensis]
MFENDNVLIPKETAWFGYYPDGAFEPIVPAHQTVLYTEDWIGLKALDDAGRVHFVNVSGGHLGISRSDMKRHVVPFLVDEASIQKHSNARVHGVPRTITQHYHRKQVAGSFIDETSNERILDGSSSYQWPSSVKNFFRELPCYTKAILSKYHRSPPFCEAPGFGMYPACGMYCSDENGNYDFTQQLLLPIGARCNVVPLLIYSCWLASNFEAQKWGVMITAFKCVLHDRIQLQRYPVLPNATRKLWHNQPNAFSTEIVKTWKSLSARNPKNS